MRNSECGETCSAPRASKAPAARPSLDPSVAHPQPERPHRNLLAYRLTLAQARERRRFAHLLHDDIGQMLALAQMQISAIGQGLGPNSTAAKALLEVNRLLSEASQVTRDATFELHSPVLPQLGFGEALRGVVQRLQRNATHQIHLRCDEECPTWPEAVSAVVLRVLRELAWNAQKHAAAANVWVSVERGTADMVAVVADDGQGFIPLHCADQPSSNEGFGLLSAQAQIQALGGELRIDSTPGQGSRLTLRVPLNAPISPPLRVSR